MATAKKKPAAGPTILDALRDPDLFAFTGPSWDAWEAVLAGIFGLPMTAAQLEVYRRLTGRTTAPPSLGTVAREAYIIAGRRGGKSRVAAAVAVYLSCFRSWAHVLAPGEVGTIMLIAQDRKQARVLFRYIKGLLERPLLRGLVVGKPKADRIVLTGSVEIEIHTSSFRSTRGYTIIAAVVDEVAYMHSDDSANPADELLAALRPGMATTGGLLLCISSPYAKRGPLFIAYRQHFGVDGDPVQVFQAATRELNPQVDEQIIRDAYEADETAARAEYGAEFRSDLESYVDPTLVQQLVAVGRSAQPWSLHARHYVAFCDPAGGSGGDSMALAVAHLDQRSNNLILDVALERKPPFSPEDVVAEFCAVLKSYGNIRRVVGDRFGGEWPAERFRVHGVAYVPSEKTKSQIYADVLPLLNSRAVELLDDRRLLSQLIALERRTAWGGRDSIDHAPGGHDDVINAAAGALVLAAAHRRGGSRPARVFGRPTVTDRIGADSAEIGRVIRMAEKTF